MKKWGNSAAKKYWMAAHNKTLYPLPDRRDTMKMKDFMRMKYVQKRFLEENNDKSEDSDEEEESSDEDKKKKKKTKTKSKAKTKKTKHKKKKKSESEDEASDSEEDDDESEEEQKADKKKNGDKGKLKQPSSGKALGAPKQTHVNPTVKQKLSVKDPQPKKDNSNILELEFDTPEDSGSSKKQDSSGWASFGFDGSKENKPSSTENDIWGAFDTKAANEKKTNDLLSSLGDLYSKAAPQPQYSQFSHFSNQQNIMPGFQQQSYSNPSVSQGMQSTSMPTSHQMPMSTSDPFAMAMHEQHKEHFEQMQKTQAAKMAQQTPTETTGVSANPSGITPNMFFQQMFSMFQNSGQVNPNQQAMMMAAMQNMMQQMSMKGQQPAPQETTTPPPPVAEPPQDKTNGAFKNLFMNEAASSLSGPGTRHSDLGSKPTTQSTGFGGFGGFGQSSGISSTQPRTSEPSNPFGNFGTQQTTTQSNIFDTQFSNSGFTGGQSSGSSSSNQPASSNPFDMFK